MGRGRSDKVILDTKERQLEAIARNGHTPTKKILHTQVLLMPKQKNCHRNFQGDGEKDIKKNKLRPWKTERFCIPERDLAHFVSQSEC